MFFLSFCFFFFFKFFFNTGDPVTEQSHSCLSLPSLLSSARNLWSGLRVPRPRKTMSRRLACLWNSLSRRRRQPPSPATLQREFDFHQFYTSFSRGPIGARSLLLLPLHRRQYNLSFYSFQAAFIYIYVYIFGLA